jgi:hypothetical protein
MKGIAMCRDRLLALAIAAIAVPACGPTLELGHVRGRITVQGKPGTKIRVEFHPDADRGTSGPLSFGDTNDAGEFVLAYATPTTSGSGAVVGQHKVVLRDAALAASATGRGVPMRFATAYSSVLSTPLEVAVKQGEQEMLINVPPPSGTSP